MTEIVQCYLIGLRIILNTSLSGIWGMECIVSIVRRLSNDKRFLISANVCDAESGAWPPAGELMLSRWAIYRSGQSCRHCRLMRQRRSCIDDETRLWRGSAAPHPVESTLTRWWWLLTLHADLYYYIPGLLLLLLLLLAIQPNIAF